MQDDIYAPSKSLFLQFDNPEAFADAIPGGKFGVLPIQGAKFQATVRVTNLTDGVAIRGVSASEGVSFRSEFIGSPIPSITYMFPIMRESGALFDGKEFRGSNFVSRGPGQTPQLRTFGPYEMGVVVLRHEALRRAAAAFSGQEHARLLLTPASLGTADPEKFEVLKRVYLKVSRLIEQNGRASVGEAAAAGIRLLRDEVTATLVETLITTQVKRDHLARQRQTLTMARIERFIDGQRDNPAGLQQLCEDTGLALRTVETIVRDRTGLSALGYLQRRRLAFAREALLRPDNSTSVTAVAMQNGFIHLGRFAGLYRTIYGEPPSVTLFKALGRN